MQKPDSGPDRTPELPSLPSHPDRGGEAQRKESFLERLERLLSQHPSPLESLLGDPTPSVLHRLGVDMGHYRRTGVVHIPTPSIAEKIQPESTTITFGHMTVGKNHNGEIIAPGALRDPGGISVQFHRWGQEFGKGLQMGIDPGTPEGSFTAEMYVIDDPERGRVFLDETITYVPSCPHDPRRPFIGYDSRGKRIEEIDLNSGEYTIIEANPS